VFRSRHQRRPRRAIGMDQQQPVGGCLARVQAPALSSRSSLAPAKAKRRDFRRMRNTDPQPAKNAQAQSATVETAFSERRGLQLREGSGGCFSLPDHFSP
jgi:hypothetical protein